MEEIKQRNLINPIEISAIVAAQICIMFTLSVVHTRLVVCGWRFHFAPLSRKSFGAAAMRTEEQD